MTRAVAASKESVLQALREVVDPCSVGTGNPVDIVDLGLVDDILVDGSVVTVRLLLTDPACFFFRDLKRYISDVVGEFVGTDDVRIELVSDRFWTPRITVLDRPWAALGKENATSADPPKDY